MARVTGLEPATSGVTGRPTELHPQSCFRGLSRREAGVYVRLMKASSENLAKNG